MSLSTDLNKLYFRRSELHRAGAVAEAIPLQIEILHRLETGKGLAQDIANAHNYLSVLYTKTGDYISAMPHAQRALDLHSSSPTSKDRDALACYSMMMARILYLLKRRKEAIPHTDTALQEWSTIHPLSGDFFKTRQEEVAAMIAGTWTNPSEWANP